MLKPVNEEKIKREIVVLNILKGGTNIISLLDVCYDFSTNIYSLIFESVKTEKHTILFPLLSESEIRYYAFQLLQALDYAHSNGIMHRDVKPQNIVIDRSEKKLKLIDWGLAEFYFPERVYHMRVSSRPYKGPELLTSVHNRFHYDYSLDMWCFGCTFASMVIFRAFQSDNQCSFLTLSRCFDQRTIQINL